MTCEYLYRYSGTALLAEFRRVLSERAAEVCRSISTSTGRDFYRLANAYVSNIPVDV